MNMLDCFAGVGCMSIGGHRVGIETAAFIEWNEDCQKVLKLRFPNIKIHGDINDFDGTEYRGKIDIVSGGFPCQPYSIAGKRRGEKDDVDEWPQMCRVISEVGPTWAICENVPGILSMEYERFIADLEGIGYRSVTLDLSAAAFGLPTVERHIWIIATPDEKRLKRIVKETISDKRILQREFQGSNTRIERRRDVSKSRFQ